MDKKEMERALEYIQANTPERTLLEQIAEEAAELSHAALKLIRVQGNGSPADEGLDEAQYHMEEELEDVLATYAAWAGDYGTVELLLEDSKGRDKWRRWQERVRAEQEARR